MSEGNVQSAVELVDVTKRFGEVVAVDDMSLRIRDGEFFSLLGPSGCGKTTTLRMIAGFEQPTAGQIYIKGRPVAGISAHRRPVNTVFQSYALFPHMTVTENVSFGLEMKKVPRAEARKRVQEVLELVQLPQMGDRKPRQLSGGQQQRVALARALVNKPQVLLLDEPLGALDLKLRKAMQLELKQIQAEVGITFIYVTHDQEEALTMSDRIAVMSDGLVQQVGDPRQIYEHPSNRFVADFIGETNFVPAVLAEAGNPAHIRIGDVTVLGVMDGRDVQPGEQITLAIRPEKINLYPQQETALNQATIDREELAPHRVTEEVHTRPNVRQQLTQEGHDVAVPGRVAEAIYIGTDTRYRIDLAGYTEIFVRVQNFGKRYDFNFNVGDEVVVHWAAENAQVLTE